MRIVLAAVVAGLLLLAITEPGVIYVLEDVVFALAAAAGALGITLFAAKVTRAYAAHRRQQALLRPPRLAIVQPPEEEDTEAP